MVEPLKKESSFPPDHRPPIGLLWGRYVTPSHCFTFSPFYFSPPVSSVWNLSPLCVGVFSLSLGTREYVNLFYTSYTSAW